MQKRATELKSGSRMRTEINKSARIRFHASLDEIQNRFQSELEALHTDFKQLATHLRAILEASSRARNDRIA
jgi:hypothetical protein